jgi:hypothetical protein
MNSRTHKKPIGETGNIRVTRLRGDPIVTWRVIRFPELKPAQEFVIASAFAKQLSKNDAKGGGL